MIGRTRRPEKRAEYEAELACPPLPEALRYLWGTFNRLRRRRSTNGFGYNPISWADIEAYMRLSGMRLAPWEVEVVEDLDDLDRAEQSRSQRATMEPDK